MSTVLDSTDYLQVAAALAQKFAQTAVERDKRGGTAKAERERLRASGLLKLLIPKAYGGLGETWVTALQIIREFAKVDSSLAHLFGYQQLQVITPHLYGNAEQKERYYRGTAAYNWFWGNALNPRQAQVVLYESGQLFYLNGTKTFCSGAMDSDMLTVSALPYDGSKPVVVVVPTRRDGIRVHNDWDNIGQRQTDSGSVTFENVPVDPGEILIAPRSANDVGTLRVYASHAVRANIFLGIALGAFEAARNYTTTAGISARETSDPYILRSYGEWTELSAAICLVDRANQSFQNLWEEADLTPDYGSSAILISAASVFTAQVGLKLTNQVFELMGDRATETQHGFDRFWRNLRTLTLHDPIDYKIREVGDWALNQQFSLANPYA